MADRIADIWGARAPFAPGTDLERIRREASDAIGRSEKAALALLREMRHLYLVVQESELMWVLLTQVAQAARDAELLQAASSCHEAAQMRGKWLRTRVKEAAPQIYVT